MSDVEIVVSHRDRAVVRLGELFLKIETRVAKQEHELAAMSAAPVPVPDVAWREPGVTALRRVPGARLDAESSRAAWVAAGAAARAIHDSPPPSGLETVFVATNALQWLRADRTWFAANPVLELAVFDRHHEIAVTGLTGREVTDVFLHGDLQPTHVFVDGAAVTGVIDWADACLGDPLFDLAVLTGRDVDRLDEVVEGYGDGVDRDIVAAWRSLRWLGEVRWMVEHGLDVADRVRTLARCPR